MGRNTISKDYPVYLESTDELLFTMEIAAVPRPNDHIPYTPLSGSAVTYKVERVDWLTVQRSFTAPPPPPGGGATELYTSTVVKIIVSVVP